jgi:hypothetical protein
MEMLAWCGAALSCLLTVPQAVRVLRAEHLDGISASTYVIVLGNAAVWAAWAICTGEHAAGVPALINGPAAILILRRLAIERRKSRNPDAVAAAGTEDRPSRSSSRSVFAVAGLSVRLPRACLSSFAAVVVLAVARRAGERGDDCILGVDARVDRVARSGGMHIHPRTSANVGKVSIRL